MELILLQDVKSLGKADEQVKVKDGYGRNLISKGVAVEATPKSLNELKLKKKAEAKLAAEQLAEAEELAGKINASEVTVKIRTGENGRVFGAVAAKEVAEALKAQTGIDVDKISAAYVDGVLKLTLPKESEEVPVSRSIQIS